MANIGQFLQYPKTFRIRFAWFIKQNVYLCTMRLKELLEQTHTSGAELARKVHVTPVFISRIVNGKATPTIKKCQEIADALGVPIAALFEGYGEVTVCPHCGGIIHITK